jgi:opacity protein-like surface antigen
MVFGAGVNYRLTDHLGVRAEYRGLSYKNPDFKDPGLAKLFTVTSEPVVSIVYRFGKSRTKEPLERTLRL